jgi:hypothetical protein
MRLLTRDNCLASFSPGVAKFVPPTSAEEERGATNDAFSACF